MPRAAPNSRGVGVSRSFDPSTMGRSGGGLQRTRSFDRSAPPSRGVTRGRSFSPSRMQRGRSNSPSRGRPAPSRRGLAPSRSFDPSTMGRPAPRQRGITASRSYSPSRIARGRSSSPSRRGISRTRSMSPSRMAAGGPVRGRSNSPSRNHKSRGIRRPHLPARFRRKSDVDKKVPAYNNPNRRGAFRSKLNGKMKRISPKESCDIKKCMCYAVPVILMIVSAGGLIAATGNAGKVTNAVVPEGLQDKLSDLIPKFDNANIEDPFSGTDIPKWRVDGAGLEVTLTDALDDSWLVSFSLAVADWDFGNPDALTLDTEKIRHDEVCDPLDGKIKVCNGDYGQLPWRGINQVAVDDGNYIVSSAARMNDFYLKNDSDDAKQYTMCHEIGHAFGLPHTDEVFGNPDLGNCLDYTDNFDVNKHPDESNYAALVDLYGPVSRKRRLRGDASKNTMKPSSKTMSDKIRKTMSAAVEELAGHKEHPERHARIAAAGWRLLHHSRHGEEHELELGDGFRVRVHMLLAQPNP